MRTFIFLSILCLALAAGCRKKETFCEQETKNLPLPAEYKNWWEYPHDRETLKAKVSGQPLEEEITTSRFTSFAWNFDESDACTRYMSETVARLYNGKTYGVSISPRFYQKKDTTVLEVWTYKNAEGIAYSILRYDIVRQKAMSVFTYEDGKESYSDSVTKVEKGLTLTIGNKTYTDVWSFTDPALKNEQSAEIRTVYFNKESGLLRYDQCNGISWEVSEK